MIAAPSAGFTDWLAETGCLAVSSHQKSKLFLIDAADGHLNIQTHDMEAPLGIAVRGNTITVATKGDPDLRVHDIAFDADGRLIFVNTKYSCLSTLNGPFWKPLFITALEPEDRCHLNGLAMRDGRPAYVTAFAESDSGWRINEASGIVIDVERNETVCRNLTKPHSPRWHGGKLWVCNSGAGEFGFVDDGVFRRVAFIPGFLRGLAFIGDYALVGVSAPRREYDGPRGAACGVYVIDTSSGNIVHSLAMNDVGEIYDIVPLPLGWDGEIREMGSTENMHRNAA